MMKFILDQQYNHFLKDFKDIKINIIYSYKINVQMYHHLNYLKNMELIM